MWWLNASMPKDLCRHKQFSFFFVTNFLFRLKTKTEAGFHWCNSGLTQGLLCIGDNVSKVSRSATSINTTFSSAFYCLFKGPAKSWFWKWFFWDWMNCNNRWSYLCWTLMIEIVLVFRINFCLWITEVILL